jgi:hypothetical protein
MYIYHRQGGYFASISRMVQEALGGEFKVSFNPKDEGIWVLFFTSFLSGFYKEIKHPYIIVQTELPDLVYKRYPDYKYFCENAYRVLDFSKNLKIGYSDSYRLEYEESKDIDVLFYGVLSGRRKNILDKIDVTNKIILSKSPPVVGAELWNIIKRSKIVLSISCYDNRYEPDWVRIAPLLSNNIFTICESVGDENFNKLKNSLVITNYENIPNTVDFYLKNPLERIKWSDIAFDYIRNNKTKIT